MNGGRGGIAELQRRLCVWGVRGVVIFTKAATTFAHVLRPFLLFGLLPLAACGPGGQPQANNQANNQANDQAHNSVPADHVLLGGRFYTVNSAKPWASAVAVKGDHFVYVGDDEGAMDYIGDDTTVADLEGRLVLPGMIDGHTHPGYAGVEQYGPRLPQSTHEELLAAVRSYSEENPDLEWLRLCCWPVDRYVLDGNGPHRRDLDAVVPDRPVWITSSVWHSAWLNSKALEVLGVGDATPDPRPDVATYVRDESGALTGWVKEGAAWQHFAAQFHLDAETQTPRIETFLRALSEHGVTTVYDGGNFGYEDHVYGFLSGLEKAGRLPVRYEGTYQVFVPERRHAAIDEMKRLRVAYGGERLRFRTIKLFMDGVLENRSGAVLSPYVNDPGHRGGTMLAVDELHDFLLELHEEKFDLHIHAIGDRAVRDALDAVEAARKSVGGELYPRITLAHLHYVDVADLPRFGELGVSANFTPKWHGFDGLDSSNVGLGPERAAMTYLARPIFDTGGNVTFSSDTWGFGTVSPFLGMHVGHNRQYPNTTSPPENTAAVRPPGTEKLDLELMVRGYTINGAHPLRMEDKIGSIETGKLADLVVLDDDLFDTDRNAIHELKPAAVMMEGRWIHGEVGKRE